MLFDPEALARVANPTPAPRTSRITMAAAMPRIIVELKPPLCFRRGVEAITGRAAPR
jgi:hypothetical protein